MTQKENALGTPKAKPKVKVDPEHAASRQRALDIKVAQQGGK